jgi:hypothetical protein
MRSTKRQAPRSINALPSQSAPCLSPFRRTAKLTLSRWADCEWLLRGFRRRCSRWELPSRCAVASHAVAVEDLRRLAAWSRGSERRVERVERPVAPEQKAAVHQRGAGGRAARRANVRHVYIHVVSHSRRTVRGGAATQRKGSSGYTGEASGNRIYTVSLPGSRVCRLEFRDSERRKLGCGYFVMRRKVARPKKK